MAKAVIGDPKVDEVISNSVGKLVEVLTDPEILANLDQEVLRDIRFDLDLCSIYVNKYLDVRNEQGRGGIKGARKKKEKGLEAGGHVR